MAPESLNYSLIIPHYNIPELLERLLGTVPVRDDLQVIVVDDCSSEEAQLKLKEVRKQYSHVEFYSTGINGGGGKARNVGLRYARGKYLIFADADDYFTPGINAILNKCIDSEADLTIFQAISLDSETYHINNRNSVLDSWIALFQKDKELGSRKLRYDFGEPWCKIIKRSVVADNKIFFEEISCHNDTKFSYLVGFHAESVDILPIVGYVVSFRRNSVINTKFTDRYIIEVSVFSEKEKFLIDRRIPEHAVDLYIPMTSDLLKGKFISFVRKYRNIKAVSPQLPLKSVLIKRYFKTLLYHLTGKRYVTLVR